MRPRAETNKPTGSATVHRLPVRGPDDARLMRQHREGCRHARETMIRRYLPLARSLAVRYRRGADPLDDLEQVACLGLVKAVDRWDPDRGLCFSSFAVPTIVGELRRYFRDHTWTVRPPRALQELALEVDRARWPLYEASGREPTVADLAQRLGRPPAEIEEGLRAAAGRWTSSLNAPVASADGDDITVADTIGSVERGYEDAQVKDAADRLTAGLDKRTHLILRLRFERDLTQAEIAERLGLSQMHVSRVIRRALDRLDVIATHVGLAA
jgi:RNA polymerase sigma-B factor